MLKTYTLDERGNPVIEPDLQKWVNRSFNADKNIVAHTETASGIVVSTVFLCFDHGFTGEGPPILWETMVFGGPMNQKSIRCAGSREQAEAMHADMLRRIGEPATP